MKSIAAFTLIAAVSASTSKGLHRRAPTGIDDTTILNYALTLEHLENAFYSEALAKFDDKAFTDAGLPSTARALFKQVADHEAAHVAFLSEALGDKATQPCNYSFPYTDPKTFAAVSQVLEGVGVSAYAGAAQYITTPAYLTAAAVVLSTEARHAAWVASAVNDIQPWSGPLDTPLTLNEVYSLASAFITSCPESNPKLPVKAFPALNYTPSTAMPGDIIDLSFDGLSDGMTIFFLTGLAPLNATVSGGKVTIPKSLNGTVYMVAANANASLVSDDTTAAGPAVFQFQKTVGALKDNSSNGSTSSTKENVATGGAAGLSEALSMLAFIPTVLAALLS